MKKIIITTLLLFAVTVDGAKLYKIVNDDGSVTYTDTPQSGAAQVELETSNNTVMPSLMSTIPPKKQTKTRNVMQPEYQLDIVSPIHEQTIRNNSGRFSVAARLAPVGKGKFELYLDGQLIQTSSAPSFQLKNVVRGEHSIQVKFINHTGKILALSKPVVFYLHQASALINPN